MRLDTQPVSSSAGSASASTPTGLPDWRLGRATSQTKVPPTQAATVSETVAERVKKQYQALERDRSASQSLANLSAGVFEAEYDLTLYFDPLDYKCQKTHALLNYYHVSYRRVGLKLLRTST